MSFRARLILSFFLVSAIPIMVLGYVIRSEMTQRLSTQYEERVDATISGLASELREMDREIIERLDALKGSIADDNQFRLAVTRPGSDRSFLLNYAETAQRLNGLSAIQIQDEEGRIISSGHFRNDFDRLDQRLVPQLLQVDSADGEISLVAMRAPEGPLYVAARADSFRIGSRVFTLVAGRDLRRGFLTDPEARPAVDISIVLPDGSVLRAASVGMDTASPVSSLPEISLSTAGALERSLTLPYIDADRQLSSAILIVRHNLAELQALKARIDSWIAIVVGLMAVLAAFLIAWNASRLSRPIVELTTKASRVDLDRLDVDFKSNRIDEIGKLSNVMGKMTRRLRTSMLSLRDAERRATVGDLARQVNHDVKNGLTPIRNIVRHLSELSAEEPEAVADTFMERLPGLNAGIAYLENLSSNYGRLSQPAHKSPCDIASILRQVAGDYNSGSIPLIKVSVDECPLVPCDPVAVRRIVENLVTNAVESLENGRGNVILGIEPGEDASTGKFVRITVADSGVGLTDEQKSRIFENFYTTKETGTGLGLSIVRRLVQDLGGSIAVDSRPGEGSRFTIELPADEFPST